MYKKFSKYFCSLKTILIIVIVLLITCEGDAQISYSETDKKKILANRKEVMVAEKRWDRKRFYQAGVFFEKIYDKYMDSSINAAIYCYRQAASSEAEYGNSKESYKAAYNLARIYESGKGVPVSLHRAMIYYYLSDQINISSYNNLGDPLANKNFQRIKTGYCNKDTDHVYTSNNNVTIDSLVAGISPFCKMKGAKTDASLHGLAEFLRQNPELKVAVTITGDNSILAAQYVYKVNNYLLTDAYERVINHLVEKEGISSDRFLPLVLNLENEKDYYTIKLIPSK